MILAKDFLLLSYNHQSESLKTGEEKIPTFILTHNSSHRSSYPRQTLSNLQLTPLDIIINMNLYFTDIGDWLDKQL